MIQPLDNFDSTLVANTSLLVTRQEPMSALEFEDFYEGVEFQAVLGGIEWTEYSASASVVGWSSFTTQLIYYKRVGDTVFVAFDIRGTSNSTEINFGLPYDSSNTLILGGALGHTWDNGAFTSLGTWTVDNASNDFIGYLNGSSTGWTASGTKRITGQFFYDI